MLELQDRVAQLERHFGTQLNGWRACQGDIPGAEKTSFDDAAWETVDVGYRWDTPYSVCWFRRWIEVPAQVGGMPVDGARLAVRISVDNGGSIFVDGTLKQASFDRSTGYAVLTDSARAGARYLIAVRGVNRPGWGSLLQADLESSAVATILPETRALLAKLRLAITLLQTDPPPEQWIEGLTATLEALDLSRLRQGDGAELRASVARAEAIFQDRAVAVIRRRAEDRLAALAVPICALAQAITCGEERGLDMAYQRVTLTVAENFRQFARADLRSDNVRIVTRGMWNADWLANRVRQAEQAARGILATPARQQPVPRFKTGPVAIRQGAFWQSGRPLFFVGVGHFDQVRRDIPILPDYGLNVAQLTISVGSVLKSAHDVDKGPIDELVAVLDRAAASHVAVDVLIEPHGWPRWATEQYPELACQTESFLRYKIDHPKAQAILEKYLNVLIANLQNALGGKAPHGRFHHLYSNGLYWGMYYVHERPDSVFAAAYLGGDPDNYDILKHDESDVISGTNQNFLAMLELARQDLAVDENYQKLAAGQSLVVVGFDPLLYPAMVEDFHRLYAPDEAVTLVGPFAGQLDDRGGIIRFLKPVNGAGSQVGFVLTDRIAYANTSSWPATAAGKGHSLTRAAAGAFGAEASAWRPLPPTPGRTDFALPGDTDRSGRVDTNDVAGFVLALSNPAAYKKTFGVPAALAADVDFDGDVDVDDVDDLVALLTAAIPATGVRTQETSMLSAEPRPAADSATPVDRLNRDPALFVRCLPGCGRHMVGTCRTSSAAGNRSQPNGVDPGTRSANNRRRQWTMLADHALKTEAVWRPPL